MCLHHVVEKRQTTSLASERALSYACEVRIGVELHTVEHSDNTKILHTTVLHDGVEDYPAVGINVFQLVPRHFLQERRHREYGSCRQPPAHVIARDVVEHGVVWNLEDIVLQFLQAAHAHYLGMSGRVAEYKVAETHVFLEYVTKVYACRLRRLVNELEAFRQRFFAVGALRAVNDERHILVFRAYVAQQFQPRVRVFLTVDGEAHVAYHTEDIGRIAVVQLHSLLICPREHHLRTSPHAQSGGMAVESLGGETLALHEHIVV